MKRNMKQWVQDMIASEHKKAMPVLSFPSVQLMGISVRELISSAESQAQGMKLIADRVDSSASVSLMDLSVEAEAFGSTIRFSDNEVPTVTGAIVTDEDEAEALQIPPVGAARTGIYIDAIRRAVELITDRPVFAGVVGPFSLAGRLLDVSPLGGEIIDRGTIPVTLKPVFDPDDHEPVAGTLTIGEGLGKRDITIELSELLKLRENLNFLVDRIMDAEFARAEKEGE